VVNSLGLQPWNALLPESARACQYYFDFFATAHHAGHDVVNAQRDAAACTRSGAKSVRTDRSSPVADRDNVCFSEDCYGLGGGVGRGLGVGVTLGVGVGVGDAAAHGVASTASSTYIPVRPPAPF
jgi:hypothetical protein